MRRPEPGEVRTVTVGWWSARRSQARTARCLIGQTIGVLLLAAGAGCSSEAVRERDAIRRFVQETLDAELSGVRWRELNGPRTEPSQSQFYSRVAWPADTEPGWDTFFIVDSYRIQDVGQSEVRSLEEYRNGDVEERPVAGSAVRVHFSNSFKFGTDWSQRAEASEQTLFITKRDGRFLIADRLWPPRFNRETAHRVLTTSQFRSKSLDGLRLALSAPVNK